MITPYLSMTLPDVLITTGSAYASEINNAFLTLDSVVGQQFTPSQLNINQDLSFQANNATNLRAVRFLNQTSSLAGPQDLSELYFQNGNFYVIDVSGNQIQMTANGTMNAPGGNIQGLAGTAAGIVYTAGTTTFAMLASTGTLAPANITAANATLYGQLYVTGSSGIYISEQVNTSTNATGSFQLYTSNGMIILSSSNGVIRLASTAISMSSPVVTPATFSSSLNVVGSTNAQVLNAGGNTSLSGTLNVVGAANMAAVTAGAGNFSLLNVSSNVTLSGALNSISTVTLSGNLNIKTTPVVWNTSNTATNTTMLSMSGDVIAQGGFRQQLGPACYEAGTFTLPQQMTVAMYNGNNSGGGTVGFASFQWVAPFQGTIVGIQAYSSLAAQTFTIQPQIAGTNSTISLAISSTGAAFTTAIKDSSGNTFTPGQVVTIQIQGANNNFNLQTQAWLTIEC